MQASSSESTACIALAGALALGHKSSLRTTEHPPHPVVMLIATHPACATNSRTPIGSGYIFGSSWGMGRAATEMVCQLSALKR